MLGYMTIGTNDFAKAKDFYRAVLAPLGGKAVMSNDRMEFYASGAGGMLSVCVPYDQTPASAGNGGHVRLAGLQPRVGG